jgi:hypothetical protein
MPENRKSYDYAPHMEATARRLLGEPNTRLSKSTELRFGTHGSMAVDLKNGIFFDHENTAGGGVLDLVVRVKGGTHVDAVQWLQQQGILPKTNGRGGATERITVAEFEYQDEAGNVVFAVERQESVLTKDGKRDKTFVQKRPDPERPGAWLYDKKGCRVVPYRLPELIEAVANNQLVVIVEGEAKVDLLRSMGVNATCCAGGAGKWKPEHSEFLRGADVVVSPDNDPAGYKHLQEAGASLTGVAKSTRVLMLPGLPMKGDVVDWFKAGGTREQLDKLIEAAPPWKALDLKSEAKEKEDTLIAGLADMEPGIDFARARKAAADELKVSPRDIDEEVRRVREDRAATPLYGHWITEPAPELVEGDDLLRDVIRKLRKHVVCTHEQALTAALWIMFAWVHDDAAVHSPVLAITSAEPESGKSTMLSLVAFLTPRCIASVEISKAALFRAIKAWSPSFAIDEFDDVLSSINGDRTELRSVVNSGHTRGTGIIRCVTDEHKPELFPTFCPKAIGLVGRKLPASTASRCIFVELRRRKQDEDYERFKHEDDTELGHLRSRLRRWAMDNADMLRGADPVMEEFNRRGDNWRLQFAIADLCSKDKTVDPEWGQEPSDWGSRARTTAAKVEAVSDTRTTKARLLDAIRTTFESIKDDDVTGSEDLINKLTADEASEWREFRGGKPITQTMLAKMLKEYKIFPIHVRPKALGGRLVRGYRRADFEDVWARYL